MKIQTDVFTNTGIMEAVDGALVVTATMWTSSGPMTATGATVTLGGAWTITGAVAIEATTLNIGGTFAIANFNFAGFSRTGGFVNLTGVLTNTDTTLALNAATGSWGFSGKIIGGTISLSDGVQINYQNGTLDGVTIPGDLVIDGQVLITGATSFGTLRLRNGSVGLAAGYTLNSAIIAEGTISGTRMVNLAYNTSGTVTIAASGSIRLAPGAAAFMTISGSAATLVNNGVISAEAANRTLTIQNSIFTNAGTVRVLSGTLAVSATTTTNYSSGILTGGTWQLGGGTITSTFGNITVSAANLVLEPGGIWTRINTLLVSIGSLTMKGGRSFTTAGEFSNRGIVDLSAGSVLSVNGGFTNTGTLTMRFGSNAGQVSRVSATGLVLLGGTLSIIWTYRLPPLGTFDLVTGANVVGTFSQVQLALPGGLGGIAVVSYKMNAVRLVLGAFPLS